MSDRAQQLLIVSVAAVLIVFAVIAQRIIKDRQHERSLAVQCPDGRTERLADEDRYLLKYSGTVITFDAQFMEKAKGSLKIGDQLLQDAVVSTQLLDQRLRQILASQRHSACDPNGRTLLTELERFRATEFESLSKTAADLYGVVGRGESKDSLQAANLAERVVARATSAKESLRAIERISTTATPDKVP